MKKNLYHTLKEYGESDYYPFHMPGHKRNPESGPLSEWYKCDITEIDGFDNLHQPEGILLKAQQRAAKIFGSEETYFLVNGSTAGILSAISAVAGRGKRLLVARNCHKAVYHAAFLNGLEPEYLYPDVIEAYGCPDGISALQVEKKLQEITVRERINESELKNLVAGVVLTSPTYDGILSDVENIVKFVHQLGIPVILDQAHGAHFGFHPGFPESGVLQGADFVIQSVHKTLPAPTQTAILHCNGSLVNRERLRKYLGIYQTSSPSYLLMAGIDSCMDIMESQAGQRLSQLLKWRENFEKQTKGLRHIRIYPFARAGAKGDTMRWTSGSQEPGKLLLSVRGTGKTGKWLYDRLRENYHLQPEMCAADYVLLILSMMDTEEGFLRLQAALTELDAEIDVRVAADEKADEFEIYGMWKRNGCKDGQNVPKRIMPLKEAFMAPYEELFLNEAVGRAVSEFINLYPPGIPLLAPGECLDTECLNMIKKYYEKGYIVQGIHVKNCNNEIKINVVK